MSIIETHPPSLSLDEIKVSVRSSYGIDVVATHDLGSYIDQNIPITDSTGGENLLKINDAREHESVLDLQNKVMQNVLLAAAP